MWEGVIVEINSLFSDWLVGVGVVPLEVVAVAVAWGSPVTLLTFRPGITCPFRVI